MSLVNIAGVVKDKKFIDRKKTLLTFLHTNALKETESDQFQNGKLIKQRYINRINKNHTAPQIF